MVEGFTATRETSCLLGAIELVAMDEDQQHRLQRLTQKGILKLKNDGGETNHISASIPSFNDHQKTTHEDVILALKHAEQLVVEK